MGILQATWNFLFGTSKSQFQPTGQSLGFDYLTPEEEQILEQSLQTLPQGSNDVLLKDKRFKEFFDIKYFFRGRHNGVNFGDDDFYHLGLSTIKSEFQNICNEMIEDRKSFIRKIKKELNKPASDINAFNSSLNVLLSNSEEKIKDLKEQLSLSEEEKGWITQALQQYKTGFYQGRKLKVESLYFTEE